MWMERFGNCNCLVLSFVQMKELFFHPYMMERYSGQLQVLKMW